MKLRYTSFVLVLLTVSAPALAVRTEVPTSDDFSKYLNDDEPASVSSIDEDVLAAEVPAQPQVQKELKSDEDLTERPAQSASPEVIAEAQKLERDATKRVPIYEKPKPKHAKVERVVRKKKYARLHTMKSKRRVALSRHKSKKHQAKVAAKKVHKKSQSS